MKFSTPVSNLLVVSLTSWGPTRFYLSTMTDSGSVCSCPRQYLGLSRPHVSSTVCLSVTPEGIPVSVRRPGSSFPLSTPYLSGWSKKRVDLRFPVPSNNYVEFLYPQDPVFRIILSRLSLRPPRIRYMGRVNGRPSSWIRTVTGNDKRETKLNRSSVIIGPVNSKVKFLITLRFLCINIIFFVLYVDRFI